MKFQYVAKAILMSSALALTFYGIWLLKSDHGIKTLEALGFGLRTENFVSWCQSRVEKVENLLEPGQYLVEEGRTWKSFQPEERALNYLSVEKWLGKYCQVEVQEPDLKEVLQQPLTPLLKITFINGESQVFYKVGEDQFQFSGQVFKSEEMVQGLNELATLVGFSRLASAVEMNDVDISNAN